MTRCVSITCHDNCWNAWRAGSDFEKFKHWSDIQVEIMGSGDLENTRTSKLSFKLYVETSSKERSS